MAVLPVAACCFQVLTDLASVPVAVGGITAAAASAVLAHALQLCPPLAAAVAHTVITHAVVAVNTTVAMPSAVAAADAMFPHILLWLWC